MKLNRDLCRTVEKLEEAAGKKWWHQHTPIPNVFVISSKAEFFRLVGEASVANKLLVCKFFTENCYACRSLAPKYTRLATDNEDVWFAKLNGSNEELQPLFDDLEITKVPYVQMYLDNKVVSQFTASLDPQKLAMLRTEIAFHKRQIASA